MTKFHLQTRSARTGDWADIETSRWVAPLRSKAEALSLSQFATDYVDGQHYRIIATIN